MYGTVARLKVKPGMMEKFREVTGTEAMQSIPGLVSTSVYQMDADSNELYLVVAFESKESYVENANSPDQAERYGEMVALLESAPDWHDGEVVYKYPS